jgi:PIN domain nuclease of toxin-antitoxin system
MRYLVDTHAAIWWFEDSARLTEAARKAMAAEENDVYVSAASAWEIATKHRIGKLSISEDLAADIQGMIERQRFQPLPVTMAHAETAGRLAGAHRDPFDRMLIAQSLLENLTLVSNEAAFDAFGVSRLW